MIFYFYFDKQIASRHSYWTAQIMISVFHLHCPPQPSLFAERVRHSVAPRVLCHDPPIPKPTCLIDRLRKTYTTKWRRMNSECLLTSQNLLIIRTQLLSLHTFCRQKEHNSWHHFVTGRHTWLVGTSKEGRERLGCTL